MIKTILLPTIDLIFKILFGSADSKEILADLLFSVLNLPQEEYEDLTISNPFLLQEYKGDKLGILDIKLKLKTGKVINIEMQVDSLPFLETRILFYSSKMVTEQIGEGDNYDKIKPVISIIITDHIAIKQSQKFHHNFGLYDIETGMKFTDKVEIHILEIPKARKTQIKPETESLLNWMEFFDIKNREDLAMVAEKSPIMKKATSRLLTISQDEQARELYEARLKEQRDIISREYAARQEGMEQGIERGIEQGIERGIEQGIEQGIERGIEQGIERGIERGIWLVAKNLLKLNMPTNEIALATGLTEEEIEGVRNSELKIKTSKTRRI